VQDSTCELARFKHQCKAYGSPFSERLFAAHPFLLHETAKNGGSGALLRHLLELDVYDIDAFCRGARRNLSRFMDKDFARDYIGGVGGSVCYPFHGKTPLQCALSHVHTWENAIVLLDFGADASLRSDYNICAVEIALMAWCNSLGRDDVARKLFGRLFSTYALCDLLTYGGNDPFFVPCNRAFKSAVVRFFRLIDAHGVPARCEPRRARSCTCLERRARVAPLLEEAAADV
jgi:hypothetical protein